MDEKDLKIQHAPDNQENRQISFEEENTSMIDAEMLVLLRQWKVPEAPLSCRTRTMAAYRERQIGSTPLWKRILTLSVPVPLPVSAILFLLLCLLTLKVIRAPKTLSPKPATAENSTEQRRVLEDPAIKDKLVTRVVFVQRQARKYRVNGNRSGDSARKVFTSALYGSSNEPAYITRADLVGFRPAEGMNVRIIRKASSDEK